MGQKTNALNKRCVSATDPVVRAGLCTIDVVVTGAAGKPVSNLTPSNFTLLDNGRPAKIHTFHGSLAVIEPAPKLIFILDSVNLSAQQLTQADSAIVDFLRRNNGRLDFPCFCRSRSRPRPTRF